MSPGAHHYASTMLRGNAACIYALGAVSTAALSALPAYKYLCTRAQNCWSHGWTTRAMCPALAPNTQTHTQIIHVHILYIHVCTTKNENIAATLLNHLESSKSCHAYSRPNIAPAFESGHACNGGHCSMRSTTRAHNLNNLYIK